MLYGAPGNIIKNRANDDASRARRSAAVFVAGIIGVECAIAIITSSSAMLSCSNVLIERAIRPTIYAFPRTTRWIIIIAFDVVVASELISISFLCN